LERKEIERYTSIWLAPIRRQAGLQPELDIAENARLLPFTCTLLLDLPVPERSWH